ncbi:hypothetical protein [Sphingobium sp. OAS761]|uniref:hypothetical protein n=1 Tax=Sphingobium sp. OAS761 TaxID=2817901 RepID=UPI00209DE916|nr:hypothetical protein [Sphingobium sp. OAS761]
MIPFYRKQGGIGIRIDIFSRGFALKALDHEQIEHLLEYFKLGAANGFRDAARFEIASKILIGYEHDAEPRPRTARPARHNMLICLED